jgi:hypothetical protein
MNLTAGLAAVPADDRPLWYAPAAESNRISVQFRGIVFDCPNRGLELVVPTMSKCFGRQGHVDVGFNAFAFNDGAPPGVPAGGREPQYKSMTDRKVAAAKHLTAGAGSDDRRQAIFSSDAATMSPALNVCSLTSTTTRPWNGFGPKPSVMRRIDRSRWSTSRP